MARGWISGIWLRVRAALGLAVVIVLSVIATLSVRAVRIFHR